MIITNFVTLQRFEIHWLDATGKIGILPGSDPRFTPEPKPLQHKANDAASQGLIGRIQLGESDGGIDPCKNEFYADPF
jgi:hypothetical protein